MKVKFIYIYTNFDIECLSYLIKSRDVIIAEIIETLAVISNTTYEIFELRPNIIII